MNWDFLVGLIVILALILIMWARVSKQTVGEVLADIKNMFQDGGEKVEEKFGEVIEYE